MFPRDKVCAGWITPAVLAELDIDPDVYRDGRVLQPITGFRTGLVGGGDVETLYGRTVSFGILRCEFDQYVLQRAGARLGTGMPVTSLRRSGDHWIVNEQVRTPLVVGAGGHFCPVARVLNGHRHEDSIIAAQEIESAERQAGLGMPGLAGNSGALLLLRPPRVRLVFQEAGLSQYWAWTPGSSPPVVPRPRVRRVSTGAAQDPAGRPDDLAWPGVSALRVDAANGGRRWDRADQRCGGAGVSGKR